MCILTPDTCSAATPCSALPSEATDFYGGSFTEIAKSIREKLFLLPDSTLVLPGHMSETTIGYEKEHNPFV